MRRPSSGRARKLRNHPMQGQKTLVILGMEVPQQGAGRVKWHTKTTAATYGFRTCVREEGCIRESHCHKEVRLNEKARSIWCNNTTFQLRLRSQPKCALNMGSTERLRKVLWETDNERMRSSSGRAPNAMMSRDHQMWINKRQLGNASWPLNEWRRNMEVGCR